MVESSLKKCFASISKEVHENPLMTEDELYSVLVKAGFFEGLGYERFGVDVKPQYVVPGERKKADYICRDEYQNVIFVLEAKKPRDEKLEDALGQLWERYVLPLKAVYGVLANGKRFLVYKRVGSNAEPLLDVNLEDATESDCNQLHRALKKPEYDITLHSRVQEYFTRIEKLSLKTDLAKENFFETFKLNVNSIFGRLVLDLMELFDWVYPRSKFLKGAYGFWQRSFAREPEKIPESWKPFLKGDDEVFKFMFCLESAHALLARLILAKACEDLKFPGIGISNFVVQKIHQFRGQIPLVGYPIVLLKLLKEMKDQLVYSIFEEDIFSWWSDGFTLFSAKSSGELLQERVADELENFSKTIAQLLFILYKYDFSEVAGDPLGDLYQQYFDKESRKALGEFYTPVEVVNYILDAVEYKHVRNRRLLDPACGSGTFLVEALHRYLKEMEPLAKKDGWASVLRELCNSPRIVGLDIHPFACLIAQVRFMLELIPYYKKAIEEEKIVVYESLQRLPIFRTDSLAIEMRPQEFQKAPRLVVTEEDIQFSVALPMKANGEETNAVKVMIPSWKKTSVGTQYNLFNLDEYFCVTQAMFDAVKEMVKAEGEEVPTKGLEAHVKKYLTNKDFHVIAEFFKPYADYVLAEVKRLQTEFEDGRLIKSIEDAVLASLLKNYLQYDFVVGNPPYIKIQMLSREPVEQYRSVYVSAFGKFDIYFLFIQRGIFWLTKGGKLGYICSNKFTQTSSASKLREYILTRCEIQRMIDFGDSGVFQNVTNYPCIVVFEKTTPRANHLIRCAKVTEQKPYLLKEVNEHLEEKFHSDKCYVAFQYPQRELSANFWNFMPPEEKETFEQIEKSAKVRLKDLCERIYQGTPSGADKVYLIPEDIVRKRHLEKGLLKPLLKGEDVRRWKIRWRKLYTIYPYREVSREETKRYQPIDERELSQKYPDIYEWFKEHEEILRSRKYFGKTPEDMDRLWYEPWCGDRTYLSETPKIITPALVDKNSFALDTFGYHFVGGGAGVYGIMLKGKYKKSAYYLFLLGLLNSSVLEFYIKHISPMFAGGYYKYNTQYLEKFPIKWPATPQEKTIANKIIQNVKLILKRLDPSRASVEFPERYIRDYLSMNIEYDEVQYTFTADHDELKPFLTGQLGQVFAVYPNKEEDPIIVETREKAEYAILSLKGKSVRQNEIIRMLIPRDNDVVSEILNKFRSGVKQLQKVSIDQLEKNIDELVFQLYNLDQKSKEIVESFVKSF